MNEPGKETRYAAIGNKLAVVEVDPQTDKVRILRTIGRKERLRVWVDCNLARPQQGPIGGGKRCRT